MIDDADKSRIDQLLLRLARIARTGARGHSRLSLPRFPRTRR